MPLTELPRQVRPETTFDPLEDMIFMCLLNESFESRWKPSHRMDLGGVRQIQVPLMGETRGGFGEGPFLQEKCIRLDLSGSKVMLIDPKIKRAWSKVAESKIIFSERESEMARKPRSSM